MAGYCEDCDHGTRYDGLGKNIKRLRTKNEALKQDNESLRLENESLRKQLKTLQHPQF